jgi:hypothetical protein
MQYVKWTIGLILLAAIAAGLHWVLPSRDIVRIVGTEVARQTSESRDSAGNVIRDSQDVRYIKAATADGAPKVYRNQDTGWGLPPYFKFNEADLAAIADNNISSPESPKWMVVTHYGWRATYFSWFPNAVSMRPATGPDERLIPWFNIVVITVLAVAALLIRRQILRLFGFLRD